MSTSIAAPSSRTRARVIAACFVAPQLLACIDQKLPANEEPTDDPERLVLTIETERERRAISPLIYGTNPISSVDCGDERARFTVCRFGGNRWTAYNWETNDSNAGRDYCYQNDAHLSESQEPAAPVHGLIEEASSLGAAAVVSVPIVDWVAGDRDGGTAPPDCSGDVRKPPPGVAPEDYDHFAARFVPNLPSGGADSGEPDTTDDVVHQDAFVAALRAAHADRAVMFSLDNEPDLWASTHPQVHPEKVTYDELVERNVDYASAIRDVWPEAPITGFVSYGYLGYLTLQDAPDADGKGDFIDYYLTAMASAEAEQGRRLVDYLDVHFYPEVTVDDVRITDDSAEPEFVEQRVQIARSLWDPTYTDPSWLTSIVGRPLELLPWLTRKIDQYYPGTQIAITEWNYGGGADVSGAIAVADVLGAFGREGVGVATYWPLHRDESYAVSGFQVYRNYDGQGASFGDTSVHAESSHDERVAVYASVDSANPDRVVAVVIHRQATAETATIELEHASELTRGNVWRLTADDLEPQPGPALSATESGRFEIELPGYSVSVLELSP